MYLGYHNIEIKTRDFLKLNFGIWNIVRFLAGFYVNLFSFLTNLCNNKVTRIGTSLVCNIEISKCSLHTWRKLNVSMIQIC